MKINYSVLTTFLLVVGMFFSQNIHAQNEALNKTEAKAVSEVISLFKKGNISGIANKISYPLNRAYPIPAVKNKQEFIKRYHQIFDKSFTTKIASSSVNDWSQVGWRGIMFDNGNLWIDEDGKITVINYQSGFEKKQKQQLIQKQKETIHTSLKKFSNPELVLTTKTYLIRIDALAEGNYRFASWKSKNQKLQPDLILLNGTIETSGSGGNHSYIFQNKEYKYEVSINVIGTSETPEATLIVYKDDKAILSQDGKLHNP